MMEKRHLESRLERLDRKKAELAERLESVCAHMSRSEFDQLIERMASLDLKYALRRDIKTWGA